ncbi:rod shape-determining protein MreC [Microbispora sp. RL4-1S]|uniref:Cell shape-determining protein MreC n=1 Tax=Microbispora oryzae TaxID=2806554 RepID=A0A940WP82_9ACTN|nr:rod shape-determining protein MreC [Microbispora oryzae]MBP2706713.1 rod shape-determining protein MreC [Microbispora oryzae]
MRDTRRARLALGLLVAAALILITVDHRSAALPVIGPIRSAAASFFGKVENVSAGITGPITGFVGMVKAAPGAERAVADLRKENARLRGELSAQRVDQGRMGKLDKMLGLAGLGRYRVVPAQVVARRSVPGFEDAVEIDAGTVDGVRQDMSVLTGEGLVGRVVQAGPDTSTVALLTDPALSAGARLEGSNEIGVVSGLGEEGGGENLVRFRLLDSSAPLAVGRRIVSFGSQQSKPYVPGVPIGIIERVESVPGELIKTAYARPFTDFSAIDVVGVIVQAPKRDPRDSVLPPVPRPAPTPMRARGRDQRQNEWWLGSPRVEAGPGDRRDARERGDARRRADEPRDQTGEPATEGRETGGEARVRPGRAAGGAEMPGRAAPAARPAEERPGRRPVAHAAAPAPETRGAAARGASGRAAAGNAATGHATGHAAAGHAGAGRIAPDSRAVAARPDAPPAHRPRERDGGN